MFLDSTILVALKYSRLGNQALLNVCVIIIFTARERSFGQGNTFHKRVSFCSQGGGSASGGRDTHRVVRDSIRSTSGRYAPYWNAFLLFLLFNTNTRILYETEISISTIFEKSLNLG